MKEHDVFKDFSVVTVRRTDVASIVYSGDEDEKEDYAARHTDEFMERLADMMETLFMEREHSCNFRELFLEAWDRLLEDGVLECVCDEGSEPHYHCLGCGSIMDKYDNLDCENRLCDTCYKVYNYV